MHHQDLGARTPAWRSQSQWLRKKARLEALPGSAQALKTLKNWNRTKVMRASVKAYSSPWGCAWRNRARIPTGMMAP